MDVRKTRDERDFMNNTKSILFSAILAVASGCSVYVGPGGPPVVVEPALEVVPVTYVWDGYEYVGDVGGRFYYYGPSGAWVVCDGVVWGRFDRWQGEHRDWRERAIRNDGEFRLDRQHHAARGVESRSAPRHDAAPARPAPRHDAAPARPAQGREAVPARPASGREAAPARPASGREAAPARPASGREAAPARPASGREAAPARPAAPAQRKGVDEKKPAQPSHPAAAPHTGGAPKKPSKDDEKNDHK